MRKKKLSQAGNSQGSSTLGRFESKRVHLTTPVLAIAGFLAMMIPNPGVAVSNANDYRVCTARLLDLGLTEQAVSQGCAKALRPRDLSDCVVRINQQTQISAVDALSSCEQARRPQDLSTCVVNISSNTEKTVDTRVLNYCVRSLLPQGFAQCVMGLRSVMDIAPTQAMDTCIDASDSVSRFSPPSASPRVPTQFSPSFEVTPIVDY
jgi:hypothetical protein